jgi:hypothetical protein
MATTLALARRVMIASQPRAKTWLPQVAGYLVRIPA